VILNFVRTKLFVCLVASATLLGLSGAVLADDHKPPRTLLKSGGDKQRGLLISYCWTEADNGGFITTCADGIIGFRRALKTDSRAVRIRFKKSQAPQDLSIRRWRKIDENDQPVGNGKPVDYTLKAHMSGNEIIAYDALFKLPSKPGHFYLAAFGVWQDTEGSGDDQDAYWTYHVKLLNG